MFNPSILIWINAGSNQGLLWQGGFISIIKFLYGEIISNSAISTGIHTTGHFGEGIGRFRFKH